MRVPVIVWACVFGATAVVAVLAIAGSWFLLSHMVVACGVTGPREATLAGVTFGPLGLVLVGTPLLTVIATRFGGVFGLYLHSLPDPR